MVDLGKHDAGDPAPGRKPGAGAPADAPRPRSIIATLYAIGVQLVFAAVAAVLAWPLADELRREIIKANNNAGKNKKALCVPGQTIKNCLNVDSTLHSLQLRTLIGTIFVTAVLVYSAVRLYRGVRTGRTLYIAVSVIGGLFVGFGGSPLAIASAFAGGPAAPRIVQTVAGLASVFAVVLLFRPDASQFFATWSPRPTGATAGGRPGGFGGLFRPAPPRERKPAPATGVRSTAASRAEARVAKAAKAKSRNDAEAIARGAELARTRAKAAKSRRTER